LFCGSIYGTRVVRNISRTIGSEAMMKDVVNILRQSPQFVIEDILGVIAIFTMVFVALHFPVAF